jgi:transposase
MDKPMGRNGGPAPRFKAVDRRQMVMRPINVEELIEEDHPARAIWAFTARMDWSGYCAKVKAVEGVAGRSAWDPRLLASVWIYAYSRGIGSAREVARRCGYDPAFQWLTGLQEINYHTLADFRVGYGTALDELFTQTLGLLGAEGLVRLERVMHDGTKIQACAGTDSFRREERIRAHLEAARAQVAAMGDPCAAPSRRECAARERARRERVERMERALEELEQLQSGRPKREARVSLSDPEARIMKQGNGGYAPSYNAQISTDEAHGIIVGAGLSAAASDYGELEGAVERVKQQAGQAPHQVVVDGGFTSRENIVAMEGRGIDLIGSMSDGTATSEGQLRRRGVQDAFFPAAFAYEEVEDCYRCPAGHPLRYECRETRIGVVHYRYRAPAAVCAQCPFKPQCCPGNEARGRAITRAIEAPAIRAFVEKMQTDAAKAIYRRRGPIAEFPNAWIKAKLGLRQFRVRGRIKALMELLWACLTYNIQQWIRLSWRMEATAGTA